jgi:hypothetical protein
MITSPDGYTSAECTIAINKLPQTTNLTERLNIFEVIRTTTTDVVIQVANSQVFFIDDTSRDDEAHLIPKDGESRQTLRTLHLPVKGYVRPGDIQNLTLIAANVMTALGLSGDPMTTAVNNEFQRLKNILMTMREYHRISALKGQLLNKDGKVILDFFDKFKMQKYLKTIDFSDKTLEVADVILNAVRNGEAALSGQSVTGFAAICGKTWFDNMRRHRSVAELYKNWAGVQSALAADARQDFSLSGVSFREVNGAIRGRKFVDDDACHIYPVGGVGVMVEHLAPGNYDWAVNMPGMDFYASIEKMKHGKGSEIVAETNPLPVCTYPEALAELRVKPQ